MLRRKSQDCNLVFQLSRCALDFQAHFRESATLSTRFVSWFLRKTRLDALPADLRVALTLLHARSSRGVWLDRARWYVSWLGIKDPKARARNSWSARHSRAGTRAPAGTCHPRSLTPRALRFSVVPDPPLTSKYPPPPTPGERPQSEEEFLQEVQEALASQGDAVQDGQGLALRAGYVRVPNAFFIASGVPSFL